VLSAIVTSNACAFPHLTQGLLRVSRTTTTSLSSRVVHHDKQRACTCVVTQGKLHGFVLSLLLMSTAKAASRRTKKNLTQHGENCRFSDVEQLIRHNSDMQ
jgi:hypothetical protein